MEPELLPVFIIIITSDLSSPSVSSTPPHYDLSQAAPPPLPPSLPPGQLDLVLSHPPGQLLLSQGCQTTELLLVCPVKEVVVVESGRYTTAMARQNCSARTMHSVPVEEVVIQRTGRDITQALNRRCSGYSSGEECRFSLLLDLPQSRRWGGGWVEVWHRCVPQENITTTCGVVRQVNRGYIMSRTYPKYYLGGDSCTYHISVPPSQSLLVIVRDLQVRGLSGGECEDSLTIDYHTVLCGEIDSQLYYTSHTGRAVLMFSTTTGYTILPNRGFLVEIVPVGCTPPTPSSHSRVFLASHNQTHATYQCWWHHVFPSTMSSTTTLLCRGTTYHTNLSRCVPINHLISQGNISVGNTTNLSHLPPPWLEDIFLPLVLTIITLVLSITALILLIIIRSSLDRNRQDEAQVGQGRLVATLGPTWEFQVC